MKSGNPSKLSSLIPPKTSKNWVPFHDFSPLFIRAEEKKKISRLSSSLVTRFELTNQELSRCEPLRLDENPDPNGGASYGKPLFLAPKKKTNCPLTFETPKSLIFSQNQVALRLEGVQRKDKHVSRQNSHSHIHFHGFKKSF